MKGIQLILLLILCLPLNSKIFGQNTKDTICITTSDFRLIIKELNDYKFLRTIDSNRVLIIRTKDSIIGRQATIIRNKDILLHLEESKRKRQGWIIGGTLGGALIVGVLTSFFLR